MKLQHHFMIKSFSVIVKVASNSVKIATVTAVTFSVKLRGKELGQI